MHVVSKNSIFCVYFFIIFCILDGLVLWQVQFFNLEYIIVYGFHSKIAAADNMDVPGGPPCWWTKPNMTLTWK